MDETTKFLLVAGASGLFVYLLMNSRNKQPQQVVVERQKCPYCNNQNSNCPNCDGGYRYSYLYPYPYIGNTQNPLTINTSASSSAAASTSGDATAISGNGSGSSTSSTGDSTMARPSVVPSEPTPAPAPSEPAPAPAPASFNGGFRNITSQQNPSQFFASEKQPNYTLFNGVYNSGWY
jgi:hypothetical protein